MAFAREWYSPNVGEWGEYHSPLQYQNQIVPHKYGKCCIYDLIIATNGIDCRVYGMSNQMFQEKKRQAEYTKRQLDESLRQLQQTGN